MLGVHGSTHAACLASPESTGESKLAEPSYFIGPERIVPVILCERIAAADTESRYFISASFCDGGEIPGLAMRY